MANQHRFSFHNPRNFIYCTVHRRLATRFSFIVNQDLSLIFFDLETGKVFPFEELETRLERIPPEQQRPIKELLAKYPTQRDLIHFWATYTLQRMGKHYTVQQFARYLLEELETNETV